MSLATGAPTYSEPSSVLVVDEDGDCTTVEEAAFWASVERAGPLSFLCGFGREDRRYCRVRHDATTCVIELDLAGCTDDDTNRLRAQLEAHFLRHTDSAIGFVFDPGGTMEDYDWDHFFVDHEGLRESDFKNGLPEVIGLRSRDLDRLGLAARRMRIERRDGVVLLRSRSLNDSIVHDALVNLLGAGVANWDILQGVAYGMSFQGRTRLEIVTFFWHLANSSDGGLTEEEIELLGSFSDCLLGRCALDDIVRLFGDPEDRARLAERVAAQARLWRPPS